MGWSRAWGGLLTGETRVGALLRYGLLIAAATDSPTYRHASSMDGNDLHGPFLWRASLWADQSIISFVKNTTPITFHSSKVLGLLKHVVRMSSHTLTLEHRWEAESWRNILLRNQHIRSFRWRWANHELANLYGVSCNFCRTVFGNSPESLCR